MNPFVNIQTVFSSTEDRSLASLKKIYEDRKVLLDYLEKTVNPFFDDRLAYGKRVFLKPNWVRHDKKTDHDVWCLRTHDNFVLAAVEFFLRKSPSQIIVGDAPVQSCKWELMFDKSFFEKVNRLSRKYEIPVRVKDYRRVTFDPSKNKVEKDRSGLDEYTIFDLGEDSFLEPISYGRKNPFRVTSYDPARLAQAHGPGYHKYCITHELFDSDLVVSLPKIKTHQKAGITAALKNIVGLNGDKDFLPHHRKGGAKNGGDCYPGNNPLRKLAENLLDFANSRQEKWSYWIGIRGAALLWRLSLPKATHQVAAGWYGNDTTWRMVLDLNKIALYGTREGKIKNTIQRHFFSLGDGIIGGQGNGPLDPDLLPLGIVTFTNHSGMHDVICGVMMDFNFKKINLLRTVYKLSKKDNVRLFLNSRQQKLDDFKEISVPTVPPPGWVEYLTPHLTEEGK